MMSAESLIDFPLLILKSVGQNVKNDTIYSKIATALSFVFITCTSVSVIVDYYLCSPDIKEQQIYYTALANFGLYIVDLIVYRMNINLLKAVISSMGEFWRVDHVGPKIAQKQLRLYKIATYALRLYVLLAFVISIFLYAPVVYGRKLTFIKSPVFMQTPVYEILLTLELLNMVAVPALIIGFSSMMCIFLVFCYCQLMMLNQALKNLDFDNIDDKKDEERVFNLLKHYVDYSVKILKFFKKINSIYSYAILFEFYSSIFNNCVPLYTFARSGESEVGNMIRALVTIAANMWQVFLTSLIASLVTEQAELLSTTVYATNWPNNKLSPRIKVGLMMIMQRSQRKEEFIAGRILAINMPNLVKIVQLAFSFYTLMKSFN